jgi:hypothetical protein
MNSVLVSNCHPPNYATDKMLCLLYFMNSKRNIRLCYKDMYSSLNILLSNKKAAFDFKRNQYRIRIYDEFEVLIVPQVTLKDPRNIQQYQSIIEYQVR